MIKKKEESKMSFKQSHHKQKNIQIIISQAVAEFDFQLLKDTSRKKQPYFWHIKNAGNHKILAVSETYANQDDARNTMMGLVDLYFDGLNKEKRLIDKFNKYANFTDKVIVIIIICWFVVAVACLLSILS